MIAKLISSLKNSALSGAFEYYAFPRKQNSWGGGGPFNGQQFRRRIFLELLVDCDFSQILETGSFRGITTEYMQVASQLPVTSVEYNSRFHAFAKAKLAHNPKITLCQGDSRSFLKHHFADAGNRGTCTFIYLDAHWRDDLPLNEELEIINDSRVPAVIMIDDFEVADDDGYAYDDYGANKALNATYLNGTCFANRPWFYPQLSGRNETGARRGAVILPTSNNLRDRLRECSTLREWHAHAR